VTIDSSGVTAIGSGVIVNADVSATAAIAGSKIAPDFGAQNVLTTGTITGANLNVTGTAVPTTGAFRPAANVLAWATNSLERMRLSPGGALLVGATAEPSGQISGTVLANSKLIIGTNLHGIAQRYAATFTTTITQTTGSIVFGFRTSNATVVRNALITLSLTHISNSNTATNNPAASYIFRVFNTTAGVCGINGLTTIMEYQYVRTTHFTFADLGSGQCTITLANPAAANLVNTMYEIKIISSGTWFLDTVTAT
jgi:hypothetical protein